MAKKFKNALSVRGPKALLFGFAYELEKMGYDRGVDFPFIDDALLTGYMLSMNPLNDCFIFGPQELKMENGQTRLIYDLPEDWHIAIKKAAEYEEVTMSLALDFETHELNEDSGIKVSQYSYKVERADGKPMTKEDEDVIREIFKEYKEEREKDV